MFTPTNLPKFQPNTSGRAKPKPGATVVACLIPASVTMNPWGTPITIEPGQGYWHCALKATDAYPNNEFETFYEITGDATSDTDPRAAFLFGYWKALGHDVKLVVAEKTKTAIVVGILDEDGIFETKEGPVNFVAGSVLIQSPDRPDQMWPVTQAMFEKKYLSIEPA
jgi:hypothetical protein